MPFHILDLVEYFSSVRTSKRAAGRRFAGIVIVRTLNRFVLSNDAKTRPPNKQPGERKYRFHGSRDYATL
ncbi:hypothetical protein LMTR13_23955 [Bradyrhizobium icense]|uniref:Uncharacterized protein n=1 Tax=Bradyrhizobium icense TaxID=1274631 RepID=A0A1B1UJ28_9BRAD|nr:hypothetical protein LMTR13_23955 [Bradyrhizobium icense]